MFQRKLLALIGSAFALALVAAEPTFALGISENRDLGDQYESGRASSAVEGGSGQRIQATESRSRRNRAAAPGGGLTPDEIKATVQAMIIVAGATCQVTEAVSPGSNAEQQRMYEAACAEGPGQILIAATPPQAFSCLELAGTAYTTRLRDPAADVGQQCALPANQNGLAVIGGWAREAGVTCSIDEAVAVGKANDGNTVYEVGCSGADGYWLVRVGAVSNLQDCLEVSSNGGACRFTTAQEQADGFEPKLAGTDAAGCDVTQVRLMGQNANGRFYEAKCAAEGEGYIARVNNEGVTQQIYPCATAQRIGGGCTLTPAPAAAPAPTE